MLKEQLIAFEKRVAEAFEAKQIKGPVHLSGGNEDQLIKIFQEIHPEDWICTSYRNHYHALLHGVPEEKLFEAICAGHSMTLQFPEHRFFSTAIVGGQLSIAVGIAAGIKREAMAFDKRWEGTAKHTKTRKVWCFLGDMAWRTGAFHEANNYSAANKFPIEFVIEDNGLSCNSPTIECWGGWHHSSWYPHRNRHYSYKREYPHVGLDKWVQF